MQLTGLGPWRFRWVFDYSDKPSKRGVWNWHSNTDPAGSAFLQSKKNLVAASIEVQDREKNILRLAECKGEDYCNFEWVATVSVPGNLKGSLLATSQIVGIKLVTRSSEVCAYNNGQVLIRPRQFDDKLFHYGRMQ